MAALPGNNLASNYKGFINIGATINQNISASLQHLTDGDGNNLPIQVSTTQVSIGDATGIGRLIVRGDGANPIFRTEHTDGTFRFINTHTYSSVNVSNGGSFYIMPNESLSGGPGFQFVIGTFGNSSYVRYAGDRYEIGHVGPNNGAFGMQFTMRSALVNTANGRFNFATAGGVTATTGTLYGINFTDTFAAAAGAANYRPLSINYTINNSGAQTGTMTGIFLNATETNLNGMTHNLMDLQVGGTSRFKIDRVGNTVIGHTSASARLHVRGDGTNPAFRVESSAGTPGLVVANNGIQVTIFELSVTDNITLGVTRGVYYGTRVGILAPAAGVMTIKNSFTDGFDRLQFGGTTNAFPALKRSSESLQAKLADDSNFTFIQGKLQTENTYEENPSLIPTGFILLYDATGTAYRVLAIPA